MNKFACPSIPQGSASALLTPHVATSMRTQM